MPYVSFNPYILNIIRQLQSRDVETNSYCVLYLWLDMPLMMQVQGEFTESTFASALSRLKGPVEQKAEMKAFGLVVICNTPSSAFNP